MEKPSFIPKKTLSHESVYKTKGLGLFLSFSVFLLVITLIFAGAVFFYKKALTSRIDSLSKSLKRVQAAFEISLIEELKDTADRIDAAKILLSQHTALTPIFEFLEKNTLKSVRFSGLRFDFSDEKPAIFMSGTAKSYSSLALQIEEFQKEDSVENIMVSGLSLGDGGRVNFSIEIVFDPSFIRYIR